MFSVSRGIGSRAIWGLGVSVVLMATTAVVAQPPEGLTPEMQAQVAKMPPEDRAMVERFTPELQQKFLALSPELRATLKTVHGSHTRHSRELTLRQVMQEMLSEYQSIAAGVATDNGEQAADSARRLANHRIPFGGLVPYFPLDKITNDSLSVLPAMNDAVEGAALRLARPQSRATWLRRQRAWARLPAAVSPVTSSFVVDPVFRRYSFRRMGRMIDEAERALAMARIEGAGTYAS